MAKLTSLLSLLIVNFALVGTTSAAIHVNGSNNPCNLNDYPDFSQFDSIIKDGSGADIVNIRLTNTGGTSINAGLLQFNGLVTNLHTVVGSSTSSLVVGDGVHLTATSVSIDTLTIDAGSIVTIRAIPGGPLSEEVSTPEPMSLLIWLLIGLMAILGYRRRR